MTVRTQEATELRPVPNLRQQVTQLAGDVLTGTGLGGVLGFPYESFHTTGLQDRLLDNYSRNILSQVSAYNEASAVSIYILLAYFASIAVTGAGILLLHRHRQSIRQNNKNHFASF